MTSKRAMLLLATVTTAACLFLTVAVGAEEGGDRESHGEEHRDEARGPHGGRLLSDGDFRIELTIFEDGVDPQFRAYAYSAETPIDPAQVRLEVELTRLSGDLERFAFAPQGEFLRGNGIVREPHSFVVKVNAQYRQSPYQWRYESFEGRTRIESAMALASDIKPESAGPAVIREVLVLHGTVVPDPHRVFRLRPRFPGVVREVRKRIGEAVRPGDVLAVIESDESLQTYHVTAPAAGIVVTRDVNPGLAVGEESLFTIVDLSSVWVELAAFQHDMGRILPGQPVSVRDVDGHQTSDGRIESIAPVGSAASQSMTARVVLPNPDGLWRPGLFVTGEVTVAETPVPLAVRRSAMQTFRDWDVVFEQVGDIYEIRPLKLGRSDPEWVEVLDGLKPGATYVSTGSYLIKADIEKSGASHDH